MKQLKARIAKLEAQIPKPPSTEDLKSDIARVQIFYLIAFYFGSPDPNGSPYQDYARALNYPSSQDLRRAEERDDPDLKERVKVAMWKLYATCGLGADASSEERARGLKRLLAGFSEYYKGSIWDAMDSLLVDWANRHPPKERDVMLASLSEQRRKKGDKILSGSNCAVDGAEPRA
jgi:hypothetical protein